MLVKTVRAVKCDTLQYIFLGYNDKLVITLLRKGTLIIRVQSCLMVSLTPRHPAKQATLTNVNVKNEHSRDHLFYRKWNNQVYIPINIPVKARPCHLLSYSQYWCIG